MVTPQYPLRLLVPAAPPTAGEGGRFREAVLREGGERDGRRAMR